MNKLNIKLISSGKTNPTVQIDGKTVAVKKNDQGNYVCEYETPNNSANVVISKYHELSSRHWLWMGILFLVISVFGLFDRIYEKDYIQYDCNLNIKLNNNSTTFEGKLMNAPGVATKYKCSDEVEEISNLARVDQKIKKRRKILLALRVTMIIAFVLTAVAIAITKIIGV